MRKCPAHNSHTWIVAILLVSAFLEGEVERRESKEKDNVYVEKTEVTDPY